MWDNIGEANHMIGLETLFIHRSGDEDSQKNIDVSPKSREPPKAPTPMSKALAEPPRTKPAPENLRRTSLCSSRDRSKTAENMAEQGELNLPKSDSDRPYRDSDKGSRVSTVPFRSLNDKNPPNSSLSFLGKHRAKSEENGARAAAQPAEETKEKLLSKSGIAVYKSISHHCVSESLAEVLRLSHFDMRNPNRFYCQLHPWIFKKAEKNVFVLGKTTPDKNCVCIASIGFIPFPPDMVWDFVENVKNRSVFDRLVSRIDVKDTISEDMEVTQLEMRVRQCFRQASREFLLLTTRRRLGARRLMCSKSIDFTQKYPQMSQSVPRGNVRCCAYLVEPCQMGLKMGSRMTFVLQVDFAGIPSVVRDYVLLRQALCIHYITLHLQQQQHREHRFS